MAVKGLKVVVVGGGIIGASVAWHLSEIGANVTVLEKHSQPANGVTAHSYGWVGTSSSLPSDDPAHFASKIKAISDFGKLEQKLGRLPISTRGSLVWLDTEAETERLIVEQQAAGVRMDTLSRSQVLELEPLLAMPPKLAAWAPADFAIEPINLTHQLLSSAQDNDAKIVCGIEVKAVELAGSRVVGVRTTHGVFPADVVVLANAGGAIPLVKAFDIKLPIYEEPAVLMRFFSDIKLIKHMLYGQDIELRPDLKEGLVSAADYPENGEDGLMELAERTLATISEMFTPAPNLSLLSVSASYRPKTEGGVPLCKFLTGVTGLYAVISHPGIMLAPSLGELATKEIFEA